MISTGNALLQLVGILLVIPPGRGPAIFSGEVRVRWVPVETAVASQLVVSLRATCTEYPPSVDSGTSTQKASGEDVDILAPPEGVAVLEHSFCRGVSTVTMTRKSGHQ